MLSYPNKKDYPQLIEKIEAYDSICVFRHINPDGDAYGSQWGLVHFLKSEYPHKKIYGLGKNDGSLARLFDEPDRLTDQQISESLCIVVDTSNWERIDDDRYKLGQEIIKIDHHPTKDDYGTLNIVNSDKSSTCEMIAEWIHYVNKDKPIEPKTAYSLYVGISTDTIRFSTNKVTWETLYLAAYLLKNGQFSLSELSDEISTMSDNLFDYVTYVRQHAQSDCDGKLIYTYIEPEVKERFKITTSQAKEYVNTFKSKEHAEIWLILVNEDGLYNVSLRSRNYAINDIATQFGGGGHENASATRDLTYENTLALIAECKKRILEHSI